VCKVSRSSFVIIIVVALETEGESKSEESPQPKISKYPNLLKVIHLAFSFLLLFTAYTTTQSLVTSLFPDYGTYALATVYFCFALGGFISPYVVSRIGIRYSRHSQIANI
jgi:hypothetical protein